MTNASHEDYKQIETYLQQRQLHQLSAFLTRYETDAPYYQNLLHSAFKRIAAHHKNEEEFSLAAAQTLINLGMHVDDYTASTEHLLSVTIRCDAPNLFDFLMNEHINLHNRDYEGKTPLYVAAILSRNPKYVQKLVDAGVDITQKLHPDLKTQDADNVYELVSYIDKMDHHAFSGEKRQIIHILRDAEQMQDTLKKEKDAQEKQQKIIQKSSATKPFTLKRR